VTPPGKNWLRWDNGGMPLQPEGPSPYRHRLVEVWRAEWSEVEVLRISDLHPATNIHGLYWRPLPAPRLEPEVAA
jgi:hypothetical protein